MLVQYVEINNNSNVNTISNTIRDLALLLCLRLMCVYIRLFENGIIAFNNSHVYLVHESIDQFDIMAAVKKMSVKMVFLKGTSAVFLVYTVYVSLSYAQFRYDRASEHISLRLCHITYRLLQLSFVFCAEEGHGQVAACSLDQQSGILCLIICGIQLLTTNSLGGT